MADEQPLGLIKGKRAGSTYEWRVHLSLIKYGWEFDYQVAILGGRRIKGGQVIDFVVYTVPFPSILFVDSDYWHTGTKADRDNFNRLLIFSEFEGRINGVYNVVGQDLQTQEMTDQAILKLFGRAN
jgi:hypothetical protein